MYKFLPCTDGSFSIIQLTNHEINLFKMHWMTISSYSWAPYPIVLLSVMKMVSYQERYRYSQDTSVRNGQLPVTGTKTLYKSTLTERVYFVSWFQKVLSFMVRRFTFSSQCDGQRKGKLLPYGIFVCLFVFLFYSVWALSPWMIPPTFRVRSLSPNHLWKCLQSHTK